MNKFKRNHIIAKIVGQKLSKNILKGTRTDE